MLCCTLHSWQTTNLFFYYSKLELELMTQTLWWSGFGLVKLKTKQNKILYKLTLTESILLLLTYTIHFKSVFKFSIISKIKPKQRNQTKPTLMPFHHTKIGQYCIAFSGQFLLMFFLSILSFGWMACKKKICFQKDA